VDKFNRIGTKIILAIGAVWLPFITATALYDMREAKKLAFREVERWGVASGESVRIGLNALMREGKMDSRFAYFDDLSNEIKGLEAIRVVRSPRVNEIFRQVREKHDIPREEEFIRASRERIAELNGVLATTRDAYERSDAEAEIADLSQEIRHAEDRIARFREPMKTDERELPKDDIDRQVLSSGETVLQVEGDRMRMVAPYKARKVGCSQAGGCHLYAREGDVLGAVNMVFSIAEVNRELERTTMVITLGKALISLLILALIYAIVNRIVLRKVSKLRKTMERISVDDLADTTSVATLAETRLAESAEVMDGDLSSDLRSIGGDEFDYLHAGLESMNTKLRENRSKLDRLATYDSLTELYNRRKFTSALQDEILRYRRHGRPLSLLMIDLDHFKDINDTHGHHAGDEALRAVSRTVNAEIRRTDIPARYGGEEIAVILPETSNHDATALAERIRRAITQEAIEYEPSHVVRLTASIGVATLSADTDIDTEDELIRSADAALYVAKREGRNCVRNAHEGRPLPYPYKRDIGVL
jgi:diguanylate cyclase (GGDEF)-like protein